MPRHSIVILFLICFAQLSAPMVAKSAEVDFSAYVLTDIRFTVEGPSRFNYNENTLNLAIKPKLSDQVWFYGDVNIINTQLGKKEVTIEDQQNRSQTDPVRLEVDQAYAKISGLGWKNLDLRIGKQRIAWGTGDRFNPTDNLNPDNMHDPLDFGKKTPTVGILAMIYAGPVTLHGVLMPFFEPATLPLTDVRRIFEAQFRTMGSQFTIDTGNSTLDKIFKSMMNDTLTKASLGELSVHSAMPDLTPANMQAAFKISGTASVVDMSACYEYVIDDFGVPKTVTMGVDNPLNVTKVDVDVAQVFPRLHVIGADMAATLPFLWDIGTWAEAAYFIPQRMTTTYKLNAGGFNSTLGRLAGSYDKNGIVIGKDRPLDEGYVKATAGLDYTFPGAYYVNVQYVRGLPNDNTNKLVENYIFGGLDKPFLYNSIKTRLFSGYCFGDSSWIIFPQVTFVPLTNVEFIIGGLFVFGKADTKFGAFGDDTVFTKAKVSF